MSDREPSALGGPLHDDGVSAEAGPNIENRAQVDSTEAPPDAKSVVAVTATDAQPDLSAPATDKRPTASTQRKARSHAPRFYAAGFWRRGAAALIDLSIVLPVALLLAWIARALAGIHLPDSRHRGPDFWLDRLLEQHPALMGTLGLILVIALVYAFVFQTTMARTIGMRVMKIRIIDVYGAPPTAARSVLRTLGYVVSTATLSLGFLWVGFDSERRGLHDWLAGTYVVRA